MNIYLEMGWLGHVDILFHFLGTFKPLFMASESSHLLHQQCTKAELP